VPPARAPAAPPDAPRPAWAGKPIVLAGAAVVVLVISVVAVLLSGGSGGGGGGEQQDASGIGGAVGRVARDTTTAPAQGGVVTIPPSSAEPDSDSPSPRPDLPAVDTSVDASPPTTRPGTPSAAVPGPDGDLPLFGQIVVDLDQGGYHDFAVSLRDDQALQLLSLADDGVETHIEVFAPDGSSEGSWDGGEPGVINGLEWYPGTDDALPATGTYVIRVIHTGGSDDPFVLGFYGTA
jgi:hypothetical protein